MKILRLAVHFPNPTTLLFVLYAGVKVNANCLLLLQGIWRGLLVQLSRFFARKKERRASFSGCSLSVIILEISLTLKHPLLRGPGREVWILLQGRWDLEDQF